MTNDLTTLSGALLEMKDQLIYELGQKGVTASYDSSTGLLGLIGEISNIQTGGGSCYHIELDNSAYTTTGSLTVSATLQSNYQPLSNATVTFTGGTSTVTATTDSNGVATATVNFSSSGTLTASYSNVSDTATVTVQTYLFYDGGVTGNVNTNYVKSHTGVNASVSSTGTTVSSTTSADSYYIANELLPNDWVAEFKIVAVNYYGGIAFLNSSKTKQWNVEYDLVASPKGLKYFATNVETWISNDYSMGNTIKLKKQGTSLEIYLNNTLISTKTITDIQGYLAWKTHRDRSRSVKFADFKVEAL